MDVVVPCPICKKGVERARLKAHMVQPRSHPWLYNLRPWLQRTEDFDTGINEGVNEGFNEEVVHDFGDGIFQEDNLVEGDLRVGTTMDIVEPIIVEDFPGAGLPIESAEANNLSQRRTYYPFVNKEQWDLASFMLFPKSKTVQQISDGAVQRNASWIKPGCGFQSVRDFQRRVALLPAKAGEWQSSFILPGNSAPAWAPRLLEFWKRNTLEVLEDMVGDTRLASSMKWSPEKHYNSTGERIYSELWSGDWWWRKQVLTLWEGTDVKEEIQNQLGANAESVTIIPLILTSDKTHLSGSGKVKAWPVMMTIGNISNDVRFVPGKHCAQLIALLPLIKGIETHYSTDDFRNWFRCVMHTVLRAVLAPIEKFMRTGKMMNCADGTTRLCFPVLCQYIADLEEQWLLTCLIQQACPKCPKRNMKLHRESGVNRNMSVQTISQHKITETRTDSDAKRARNLYQNNKTRATKALLNRQGYHVPGPFSVDYPFGGILGAVGPDLLHQLSKCAMDYLFDQWIYKLTLRTAIAKKISQIDLDVEIDARFALVPKYQYLKHFRDGILSQEHHWTVHEIKEMMRVIMGCLSGLCPPEGLALIREYLHLSRLAYYSVHTEESIQWFESALETFFKLLRNPNGPFVQEGLIPNEGDHEPQRLHYFRHYNTAIREWGAMLSYSTDRTEIWHKPLKKAYERSNKQTDTHQKFILNEITTLSAFQNMVDNFDAMSVAATNTPDGDDDPGKGGEKAGIDPQEDDIEPIIDSNPIPQEIPVGVTSFVWPKHTRQDYRTARASVTEKRLCLDGLQQTLQNYLNSHYGMDEYLQDPFLYVYNTLTIHYPAWLQDEVGVSVASINDNTQSRQLPPREYLFPGISNMRKDTVCASRRRHDTVLIKCPDRVGRGNHTMSYRKIVQLLLLFKCRRDEGELTLAYVSCFSLKRRADTNSGLYLVGRTTKFEVININDIERAVHLIPKFGSEVGSAIKVRQEIESLKAKWKLRQLAGEVFDEAQQVVEARQRSPLSFYNEFWLNSWIDRDLYKKIF